ncbi:Glycosyl transferase group 1 [Hyphomicrobium sp. GJ21]|uniref:glycosyltransferase family 4 protein n=1 Tax=Hyphomicrobium sp. GJ21 TaxID=113574 RepID=UPI000622C191|nr:glycosyltransferase family 4 protein [Hyphomicrobium sp. GJ21]CEJ86761.1 Glycosyl transferase group 1 [Hyphomicrobium sp. GJ21]
MRAIFINRFFHPDHSATSQMLSDLAFGLAQDGIEVTVITSRLHYDRNDRKLTARETISGVDVHRIWTTRFGRSRLKLRAIDYLTFYISAAWTLLRVAARGDVVVAMTDPPMLSVIAAPIVKMRGARLVNWLQDLFPEVADALCSGGKLSAVLLRSLRKLRNISLRQADMNVAIGELMAERLRRSDIPAERLCVRHNWADCKAVTPIAPHDNPLRAEWNLGNDFVVGYSGNLGRAHEFEPILTAIQTVEHDNRSTHPSIRWLFIGGGHAFERLKGEVDKRGLTSVVFRPYQPRPQLAQSLSAADIHIVTLKPELEGLIVPSKFYGTAAAGRPVLFIGASGGEIDRLTKQHNCGQTVANDDGEALAHAVLALSRDPQLTSRMGNNARHACEDFYDKSIAIQGWARMLRGLSVTKEMPSAAEEDQTFRTEITDTVLTE